MKLETIKAAKAAIYEQEPNEALVLIDSVSMPDEVIDAWRRGDAQSFLSGLQQVARDRNWIEFCKQNKICGM